MFVSSTLAMFATLITHIEQILDEGTGRFLAVFASRAEADEWWRAISSNPKTRFINRLAPQLYTYDATQCNLSGFFHMPQFKSIADRFRGRMFLSMLNDKNALVTNIIPAKEITDHVSGGW